MNLNDAINHCEEKAEELNQRAESAENNGQYKFSGECKECASEHEQLAEWLKELKTLRKAYVMACEEIGDRDCSYYRFGDDCKSFCELYDLCAGNIEYEDYFLKKARQENDA